MRYIELKYSFIYSGITLAVGGTVSILHFIYKVSDKIMPELFGYFMFFGLLCFVTVGATTLAAFIGFEKDRRLAKQKESETDVTS